MDVRSSAGGGTGGYTLKRGVFDALAAGNIVALVAADTMAYSGARSGFALYAGGTVLLYVAFWLVLRRHEYPAWASLLLELTVVGHMAGRFIEVDGVQLYGVVLAGVHMDKVIHAINTGAGAVFLTVLFRTVGARLRGWEGFTVVFVATGLAALIEIIEYVSTLVLVSTNVGGYANNAQDLVANLAGAIVAWAVARAVMGPAEITE